MASCFKVVSTQHGNFNQISYGRQKNGRLSLKLVNSMSNFTFQIRYLYGTSRDSLQSGGQGLANATAFSIAPIETYIIWNVPVLTNYKAIHLWILFHAKAMQNILQDLVIRQVTVIVYASEAEEFSQISPLGHTWTDLCGI
ncbi:hypothetical protein FH972_010867 [Carpinus fangiana]|uniref:Uncharacterized protein n=1 Tax=Carpinus fangiana TaxID=176857 RepID=A0A660KSP2_9ROSI|nr:hypothetical protein FH972_010867 [Carpinus fangiana]